MIRLSAFLLVTISLISCATSGRRPAEELLKPRPFEPETLSASIVVEHKGRTHRVNGEISLIDESVVRLDLTSGLDLPLASVLLGEDKVEYLLFNERKYFSGRPNPNALDRLFPLSIEAKSLVRILRQQKNPNDICKSDGAESVECENKFDDVKYKISWQQPQNSGLWSGRFKKMILDIPVKEAKIKFHFNDLRPSIKNKDQLSSLQVPPGFKTYPVPRR